MPWSDVPRAAWLLILGLVLVALLAWIVAKRRGPYRIAEAKARLNLPTETDFPFRRINMPGARMMAASLQNERPRRRREHEGYATLLLRASRDYQRVDGIADQYTEDLRVIQAPSGSSLPSMWDTWHNLGQKEHVLKYARNPKSRTSLRKKLEELSPPVHDTNPTLACYLLRYCARSAGIDVYQLRVLDSNVGWGSQALAACAADVGCYHGYLPFDTIVRPLLAERLNTALTENISSMASTNEFWVREMGAQQVGDPAQLYDVYVVHETDLSPLIEPRSQLSPAWRFVRPGGHVILFTGPSPRSLERAKLALELTGPSPGRKSMWPEPLVFGVRERFRGKWAISKALVWTKIEAEAG